jgi:hypothetical protein
MKCIIDGLYHNGNNKYFYIKNLKNDKIEIKTFYYENGILNECCHK